MRVAERFNNGIEDCLRNNLALHVVDFLQRHLLRAQHL